MGVHIVVHTDKLNYQFDEDKEAPNDCADQEEDFHPGVLREHIAHNEFLAPSDFNLLMSEHKSKRMLMQFGR